MAMSLALNWSPPPSSPLFDESTTPGGAVMTTEKQNHEASSSSTLTSAGPMSTSSFSASDPSLSSFSRQSGVSTQKGSLQAPPSRSYSTSPQPKSYAAAASNVQRGAVYQMPSFPGPAVTSPQSYAVTSSQGAYAGGVAAFSSYQAGLRDGTNTVMGVTEDGRRRRTTSGPQKTTQSSYQDALQYYPIAGTQSMGRSGTGLPPGAMSPTSSSHPSPPTSGVANAAAAAAANGYHPYRRTPKGSDIPAAAASPAYYSSTSTPPILPPMPGQPALAALAMPPPSQRTRAASTASVGAAKEANRVNASTPLVSYSSAVMGAARPPQATPQAGLSHLRNSPQLRPTVPSSSSAQQQQTNQAQRPDMNNRRDSNRSDRSTPSAPQEARPMHARNDSNSSFHSATDGSQSTASPPTSSGRSTPTSALSSKKPSPLSRGAAADDNDNEAVYGGSDDENTIRGRTTPTPGDKPKKNLSSKLRKALSFSTLNEIQQAEAAAAAPDRAYGGRSNIAYKKMEGNSSGETNGSSGSTRSTSPPRTPDNGAPPMPAGSSAASISSRRSTRPPLSGSEGGTAKRSLFNRKFNSSTDNISISSTVSSASVMLRKVGNLGKIARRSSLMGLTNMFNKDKDAGKEGLQGDDFGAVVPPSNLVAADDAALGAKGKKDKVKAKKGSPAMASVSHATVELESNSGANDASMTPAASYVRQHQLQMKQQAEADRIAKEKEEAERLAAIQRNTKTTDDVTESRQKMIEKEKERLKSKRGWRKKLGVGSIGSTAEAKQATGLETIPVEGDAHQTITSVGTGYSPTPVAGNLAPSYPHHDSSLDSAYDDEGLEPPMMPGAMEQYEGSGDEYETDSLRHWGEGIERSRESASKIKQVKGILKNTPSFGEQPSGASSPFLPASNSVERPFAGRLRANSYDAPQASTHPGGSVPPMSQISTTPAETDRVDGVARPSTSEEDRDRPRTSTDRSTSPINNSTNSNTTSFGHHANSSMPTLSMIMNPSPTGQRSVTAPAARRHLVFAETQIYHSTWPAHVYDRRGELATCNRLTPLLAQRIKEELNTYKMEEMAVAPSSRIHTHFFV